MGKTEGTVLTGDVLRRHADAMRTVAWEGQARQLLRWAADLIDAAEQVIHTSPPTGSAGSET